MDARRGCKWPIYRQSSLSPFLWILNGALLLTAFLQLTRDERKSDDASDAWSLAEQYLQNVIDSVETFDFMYRQKMAARPAPSPQLPEEQPTVEIDCQPWWRRQSAPLRRPSNASVGWNNELWQLAGNERDELYVYSAHLDQRPNAAFPQTKAFVQLLAVVWRRPPAKVFCRIWPSTSAAAAAARPPIVVLATVREIWQRYWDPRDRFYVPVLITCPLPGDKFPTGAETPGFVSLALDEPCRANTGQSNVLPVRADGERLDGGPATRHTVVCVKGMDFLQDMSQRFVEWLELNFQIGADKVVIYTYAVHPRMRRVIEHYRATGRLEHVRLTLPGNSPNAPTHRSRFIRRNRQQKRRNELVPYNDCLYRHVGTHRFVLIVDVDELVVPLRHDTWRQLLDELIAENDAGSNVDRWTALSIANAFFFDNLTSTAAADVDRSLHILGHNVRSRRVSPPGVYGKSFMRTANVATVFNHFPLHKQRPTADVQLRPTYYVSAELARKNHYKAECPIESRDECPTLYKDTVVDNSARRLGARVASTIKRVFSQLGIETWTSSSSSSSTAVNR